MLAESDAAADVRARHRGHRDRRGRGGRGGAEARRGDDPGAADVVGGGAAAAHAVAGGVPVIAFTNNPAAAANGAYVFGLTADAETSAVLRYARSRGVRTVAVIGDGTAWSNAASEAAAKAQSDLGLDVRDRSRSTPGSPLPAAGDAPDAVLIPGSGEPVLAAARALKDTGVQLLGTVQALDNRPSALAALDGAWIAAPDPAAFGSFSAEYEARNGGDPGAIAALAYDAAKIARTLRDAGQAEPRGLLGTESFACVTGAARFRTDGSCSRDSRSWSPGATATGAWRPAGGRDDARRRMRVERRRASR